MSTADEAASSSAVPAQQACSDALDAPAQDSPAHILNRLNDDCLREIIESPLLGMLDLWALANVCRRFRPIATKVFATRFKHFKHFPTTVVHPDWPFEGVLRTFGACIEGFGHVYLNDAECRLAAELCPNVKHLKCSIREQGTVDGLHRLLNRLATLSIQMRLSSLSLADCFDAAAPLTQLTIAYPAATRSYRMVLPKRHLPALTELNICYAISGNEDFFGHNAQLQKLSVIARSIGPVPFDYGCFGSLRNLRTLLVCAIGEGDETLQLLTAVVDRQIPIENLRIEYYHYGTAAHLLRIGQMRTIRWLAIKSLRFNAHTTRLARSLADLEAVELWSESHELGISGVREFLEQAGDKLAKVTYTYRIRREDCDTPPDEREFQRMAAVARRRAIDLRMEFVLQTYFDEHEGWVNFEAEVSAKEGRGGGAQSVCCCCSITTYFISF